MLRLFTSLILLTAFESYSQQVYDSMFHAIYVGDFSEFYCDTILCDGECVSYYPSGGLKMKGTFDNGQPVDSVIRYYETGLIRVIEVPFTGRQERLEYYENGQLASYWCENKGELREYFKDGELAFKYRNQKSKTYHPNGKLKCNETLRKKKIYSQNGKLRTKIRRREILILDRIINKEQKFYGYKHKTFDDQGKIETKAKYYSFGYGFWSVFPDSLGEINNNDFDWVIYYESGKPVYKTEWNYEWIDSLLQKVKREYTYDERKWIEAKK